MNSLEELKKQLQKKKDKVRQTAHRLGLSAIIGVAGGAAMAGNTEIQNAPEFTNDVKKEIIINDSTENSTDVALYIKEYKLDEHSDVNREKYLGDGKRAYYSHYLDGGRGGIVVSQYSMSDEDAFAHMRKTVYSKYNTCDEAVNAFANQARLNGYQKDIKTLKDVKTCLSSFDENQKKNKHRTVSDMLNNFAAGAGLKTALAVLDRLDAINKENMRSIGHEQFHAEKGAYEKRIYDGEIILSPGGRYLVHMANELQAQVRAGDIVPTQEGMDRFFKEFGNDYREQYMSDMDNSYRRIFAASLDEEKGDVDIAAKDNDSYVETSGKEFWVGSLETSEGIVFYSELGEKEIKDFEYANGKKGVLNCLCDKNGKPKLDEKGNRIAAECYWDNRNGNYRVKCEGTKLSTKSMDNKLDEALSYMLNKLDKSQKSLVLSVLDKYCKADAQCLDTKAINDPEIVQMHKDTSKDDVSYIVSKRKKFLQEINGKEEGLRRVSKNDGNTTLRLAAQDFTR